MRGPTLGAVGFVNGLQSGFLRFHQAVYQGTGGLIGHRMIGVPTLLMTSVGRRSGKRRTAALVYAKDADSFVVVASNGGADSPPGWLHNVKADSAVRVKRGRKALDARAEVIGPDHAEYARLWKLVNERNRGRYDRYQAKTSRRIQLVRLTPT
jgi:deazaflavin-dependent oxidoreductase (nitroreductase family)